MKIHIPSQWLIVAYHQPGRNILYIADIREIENKNPFLWKWDEKSWSDGKPLSAWIKEAKVLLEDDGSFNYFGLFFPKEFEIDDEWENLYQEIQSNRDFSGYHYSVLKMLLSKAAKTRKFFATLNHHRLWLKDSTHGKQASMVNYSFRNAVLDKINLKNADLKYSDFSGASLRNANLSNANLSFTNFSHANLEGADLSSANLFSSDLRNAILIETNLGNANMQSTDTCGAIYQKIVKQPARKKHNFFPNKPRYDCYENYDPWMDEGDYEDYSSYQDEYYEDEFYNANEMDDPDYGPDEYDGGDYGVDFDDWVGI